MDSKAFGMCAMHSAETYLDYLKQANKGKEVLRVMKIRYQKNKFILFLEKRPPFPDALKMKINSSSFPTDLSEAISIVCFNDVPPSVMIKVKDEFLEQFLKLDPSLITFESDFLFLVEAVKKWYGEYSKHIHMPCQKNPIKPVLNDDRITDSQLKAINTALTSDVSYIWGAPGTGKTQYVLSNCIMEYVKASKKVLLMAPTNNALEQSLRGLIKVFKEQGLDTTTIVRLGNPTQAFAIEHPEVCLSVASDFKIRNLKEEIKALMEEHAVQLEYLRNKSNFENFNALVDEAYSFEPKFNELTAEKKKKELEKTELESKIQVVENFLESFRDSWNSFDGYSLESNFVEQMTLRIEQFEKKLKGFESTYGVAFDEEKVKIFFEKMRNNIDISVPIETEIKNLVNHKNENLKQKELYNSKLLTLKNSLDSSNDYYESCTKKRNSFSGKVKCFFSRKYRNNLEKSIGDSLKESNRINLEIDTTLQKIQENEQDSTKTDKKIEFARDELKQFYNEIEMSYAEFGNIIEISIENQKKNLDVLEKSYVEIVTSIETIKDKIKCLTEKIYALSPISSCNQIDDIKKAFEKYFEEHQDMVIDEDLSNTIDEKKKELKYYEEKQEIELGERYVAACTVDYAILHYGDFPQKIDSDAHHLFVDEAAYCSMIKAGVFFSYDMPVTFLGDHMQLPPICEMSDELVREDLNYMFLWSQSSLYFPEIFLADSNMEKMRKRYNDRVGINAENVDISALEVTHRFGNNLAKILDKFVYGFGFNGKIDEKTEIIVINAPKNPSDDERGVNSAEIKAIKKYIEKFDLENEDLAVLTPYRAQLSALKKNLPRGVEASTIHASQGREWDTVIISVVDARQKFFMDSTSTKSDGLKIINTAISRAKKELILVLDYECWKYCSEYQLVGNIAVNNTKLLEFSSQ